MVSNLNHSIEKLPNLDSVYSIYADQMVSDVIELFRAKNIGCVPILERDSEAIVGIFTERDYIKKVAGTGSESISRPISDFMTPNPKCMDVNDTIAKAAILMRMGKFRHVIVTKDNKLNKVISIKDILDWVLDNQNN